MLGDQERVTQGGISLQSQFFTYLLHVFSTYLAMEWRVCSVCKLKQVH